MEKTMDIFQKRKITYTLVFLSLILIFCGASLVTQFHLAEATNLSRRLALGFFLI